ncbi:glycosyltransferase [Aeromonas caviae]|uniref:glycosyltransferase n=1 Tax=Aeromonas caviae TaxID=648 RepID=UPI0038D12A5F
MPAVKIILVIEPFVRVGKMSYLCKGKFIFINSLAHGGAERVVSRLFDRYEISKNITLLTLDDFDFYKTKSSKRIIFKSKSKILTILNSIVFLLKLRSTSLVQAHLCLPILAAGIAKLLGGRFIYQTVHCFSYSSYYSNKSFPSKYIHIRLMNTVLRRSDFHIFKSDEMIADFESFFGWKPEHYKVIYNPYDIDNIINLSTENIKFPIDGNISNIAVVGRLSSSKRPFDILTIAAEFQGVCNFHFLGDGPLKKDLIAHAVQRKLNNVFFHEMVDNPFKYISKFGFYLSCSEAEGFPNALIEAMLCGAIPIHSDCKTGPKEILCSDYQVYSPFEGDFSHEKRGILFPVGDIKAANKAIEYAIQNKERLQREFQNDSISFLKKLDYQIITDLYVEALQCQR